MLKQEVEIINKLGLHARASSKFTQTAGRFQCEVWVTRKGRRVNGKSIMGVMMLAAGCGTQLELQASGPEAEQALDHLENLILRRFDEGE